MQRSSALLAFAAFSVLILTACSPQKDAAYEDALELREAVKDAGVECTYEEDQRTDANTGMWISICTRDDSTGDATLLGVDPDETEMRKYVAGADISPDEYYLHAANWVVVSTSSDVAETIQEELGGEFYAAP